MAPAEAVDWKTNTISPVANPMYFEDPVIRTEIRPIFAAKCTVCHAGKITEGNFDLSTISALMKGGT